MKKVWLYFFVILLISCYAERNSVKYGHKRHYPILFDSVVIHGKVIMRFFACEDGCGWIDTFPNPEVHKELRTYK